MRYQHIRFYHLNIAEDFFFGNYRFCKTGFFTARTVLGGEAAFVPPWKKVRSARPYGKQNRLDLINDDPRPSEPNLRVIPPGVRTESVE